MVKYEIVKEIANKTGITQKDIDAVLTAFQEVVRENVIKGENIKMVGFINFEKITIPAKSGVSKLKGVEKAWTKPAHKEATVKALKSFKNIFEA